MTTSHSSVCITFPDANVNFFVHNYAVNTNTYVFFDITISANVGIIKKHNKIECLMKKTKNLRSEQIRVTGFFLMNQHQKYRRLGERLANNLKRQSRISVNGQIMSVPCVRI